ncbi:hypothetical protein PSN45_001208 [Yamadazyma tenuis]|uniref:Uncharacterized protein n=1 Tax=Candida tenuis (strain ATCC 10573 / BCRC 21748 / CBS 615 / JCM 9827 / NBRC 10315 / NRRL Y-1498 / VKM Y-70) TaxID=590646 RepID=G3B932_CANTC|nr:uncharacterized protein CANTEDRAFT_115913 [Yamadazyma tenuis ATCC 10573]XP_006689098.1 uncharacterized protein CANTEDRAFT_115913 [Yamadazyma tenuis ATCC 10573]EGV62927.1 hypothetical protein CANTEDRAFT_115913 [Yamadazyma tenuis ATCC 10573]EGV62928.1 hypothetical protein CANTEDRAFT_115913 [Yamadazyma tenuis ATCC 10573]WEJ93735.1 hypothetical protein PSN45_001208 [Yamadazyma tenuis]
MLLKSLLSVVAVCLQTVCSADTHVDSQPHSESFYLVALKLPSNAPTSAASDFSVQTSGFQYVVYDSDWDLVVNSSVDSTKYNVTGVINGDLSLSVAKYPGAFLAVQTHLEVTNNWSDSAGHFSIHFGNLLFDNSNNWVICQDATRNKNVLVPKQELDPSSCDCTTDVVVRAYSYTADGGLPDFPLHK